MHFLLSIIAVGFNATDAIWIAHAQRSVERAGQPDGDTGDVFANGRARASSVPTLRPDVAAAVPHPLASALTNYSTRPGSS